jgi:hypothetical protein
MNSNQKNPLRNYAKYSNIAIQMLVVITAGVFGGYKLDELLKLKFPVFTLVLSVSSVILAIYLAVRDFLKK